MLMLPPRHYDMPLFVYVIVAAIMLPLRHSLSCFFAFMPLFQESRRLLTLPRFRLVRLLCALF